jgi:hypothetical protein
MSEVTVRGPLLTGAASIELALICKLAQEDVASAALERVQWHLNASIRHPTPYYETQITTQTSNDMEIVHDRGIVYGPWLEGTSRRNQSTRFKGYQSFRKAYDDVVQKAPAIVTRTIRAHLGALK